MESVLFVEKLAKMCQTIILVLVERVSLTGVSAHRCEWVERTYGQTFIERQPTSLIFFGAGEFYSGAATLLQWPLHCSNSTLSPPHATNSSKSHRVYFFITSCVPWPRALSITKYSDSLGDIKWSFRFISAAISGRFSSMKAELQVISLSTTVPWCKKQDSFMLSIVLNFI